ncbi:hypothetical protein FHT87_002650 [Rhizobium sp. BK316]|nr:hypothetical protein [Rhizobium sp. BK316]
MLVLSAIAAKWLYDKAEKMRGRLSATGFPRDDGFVRQDAEMPRRYWKDCLPVCAVYFLAIVSGCLFIYMLWYLYPFFPKSTIAGSF